MSSPEMDKEIVRLTAEARTDFERRHGRTPSMSEQQQITEKITKALQEEDTERRRLAAEQYRQRRDGE